MELSPDLELRHLLPKNRTELVNVLEMQNSWRSLIETVPQSDDNSQPKFTAEHVRLIEKSSVTQKRPCSEILLEEWGTMGRKRPTLRLLLQLLTKAELFRAADYIASLLGSNPVERPQVGPAAPVCMSTETATSNGNTLVGSRSENLLQTDSNSEQTIIERRVDANDCNTNPTAHFQDTVPVRDQVPVSEDDFITFKFGHLQEATENFAQRNKIGSGAFSEVFSCLLGSKKVAVKKFTGEENLNINLQSQFLNEIKSLKRYKHENLLPLIGYCCDSQLCLVYDFMPNGCLQDQLASKDLSSCLRLKIACGTAEGIRHLHCGLEKPLIHRDIKTANILLDDNFIPKLGDFGLVRSINSGATSIQTTTAIGTSAYMAPEAFRGDISVKMDTWSFGVVLLELLTGLPPYDENRKDIDLVTHICENDELQVEDIMDKAANWELQTATKIYDLALLCMTHRKASRPAIPQVLEILKGICNFAVR